MTQVAYVTKAHATNDTLSFVDFFGDPIGAVGDFALLLLPFHNDGVTGSSSTLVSKGWTHYGHSTDLSRGDVWYKFLTATDFSSAVDVGSDEGGDAFIFRNVDTADPFDIASAPGTTGSHSHNGGSSTAPSVAGDNPRRGGTLAVAVFIIAGAVSLTWSTPTSGYVVGATGSSDDWRFGVLTRDNPPSPTGTAVASTTSSSSSSSGNSITYQFVLQPVNVAPTVPGAFTVPAAGVGYKIGQVLGVDWGDATDDAGSTITYDLEYSRNNGTWTSLASALTSSAYTWNTLTFLPGTYLLRARAFDGFVYGPYVTSSAFSLTAAGPRAIIG